MTGIKVETDKKTKERAVQLAQILMPHHDIFKSSNETWDSGSFLENLMKASVEDTNREKSSQAQRSGEKYPPFDMRAMKQFRSWNPHHSQCVETKIACTVGLGFRDAEEEKKQARLEAKLMMPMPEDLASLQSQMVDVQNRMKLSKAEQVLNPLCEVSFLDVLTCMASDYWDVRHAYMEVVRSSNGEISAIYWMPAEQVRIILEHDRRNYHFVQRSGEGPDRYFAKFGDVDGFKRRNSPNGKNSTLPNDGNLDRVTEVIMWRGPLSLNRWYSYPDWLSAVPTIELVQMVTQHEFDFFQNRGVPEFMLFVLGKKVNDAEWKQITDALQAGIGLRKQHKSIAINIQDPEIKIELEKLGLEGTKTDSMAERGTKYSLDIVSAHGMPPLIANIAVPGKMGAANEMANALLSLQLLKISPAQRSLWNLLSKTLGKEKSLGLTEEDFRLRAITDEFDINKADTMARMRTPVAEAQAEGRDLSQGLKQRGNDDKGEGK